MDFTNSQHTDYELIAQAIRYLESQFQRQPSLDDLATQLGVSPFHLQRLFKRWAGISPKRFLQFLTVEYAKELLECSHSVLDATFEAGLSSPGRLHDLFVAVEAVTPGEFKSKGAGLRIAYGRHETPFGDCLLATTDRGICALSFLNGGGLDAALTDLAAHWQYAELVESPATTQVLVEQVFPREPSSERRSINLLLKGTNFQVKVWQALLRIPAGAVCSYVDVARLVCGPNAARAVGNAVSANPIGYLIPCHRVIRQSGIVSDYRWGAVRKKAILGWEAAQRGAA